MITKNKITIVVADDHPIMLKGINDELITAGYEVIGTANNGTQALEMIATLKPMIAMLDIEMPLLSGFEVIKRGLPKSPQTKFIIMSYHKENGFLVQAKKCGAQGYLLKEDGLSEIEACIEAVLFDEIYYGNSLDDNIQSIVNKELKKLNLLTPSERSILRLIYKGNSSIIIANQLGISKRTVEKHRSNIIKKLDLDNRLDALSQWIINHKELIELL